jgi:septum formation protein
VVEISFEVVVQSTEETYPLDLIINEVPVHIAREKAMAVQTIVGKEKVIVAADTVVVLNNTVIGKPKDEADAIAILTALSGKQHEVITGVVILNGFEEIAFADVTEVTFHSLTKEQIEFYVKNICLMIRQVLMQFKNGLEWLVLKPYKAIFTM